MKRASTGVNGRTDQELMMLDPKNVKRILANRQSAAKSKERRIQHAIELEHKLAAAQEELDQVSVQAEELSLDNSTLTQYNDELSATVGVLLFAWMQKVEHTGALSVQRCQSKLDLTVIASGRFNLCWCHCYAHGPFHGCCNGFSHWLRVTCVQGCHLATGLLRSYKGAGIGTLCSSVKVKRPAQEALPPHFHARLSQFPMEVCTRGSSFLSHPQDDSGLSTAVSLTTEGYVSFVKYTLEAQLRPPDPNLGAKMTASWNTVWICKDTTNTGQAFEVQVGGPSLL
eukprot:363076-Pelagomonas_calceolata.AAC.1